MTAPGEEEAAPVGVLGGTFDPVHLGHLGAADQVRRAFALSSVLLVPSATPPHKDRPLASEEHRLAMLRLACAERPGLEVSTIELDRGGVSYTLHTLRALRAASPGRRPLFILGADAFAELASWHRPEALVDEFHLVVVDRPGGVGGSPVILSGRTHPLAVVPVGAGAGAGRRLLDGSSAPEGRVFLLTIPPIAVSSSAIRDCAAAGLPLDGLVPPAVGRYIHEQDLYRQEVRR